MTDIAPSICPAVFVILTFYLVLPKFTKLVLSVLEESWIEDENAAMVARVERYESAKRKIIPKRKNDEIDTAHLEDGEIVMHEIYVIQDDREGNAKRPIG